MSYGDDRRTMSTKTYAVRESEIERRWYVVDAADETLGRLASRIARVLEGKHKPTYAPNLDTGDHVIVLNAARIAVTRNKRETKLYIRHSGHPQGRQGDAAADEAGRAAAAQAEGLRRNRPSPSGPAA